MAQIDYTFHPPIPLWEREDTVEVLIIGDLMMHSPQLRYNHRAFLEGIRPRLESATLSVANMEFTLAGKPYTGYPCFSSPDSFAEYVRDCGVDVFLMANNHIFDKGAAGARRTMRVYDTLDHVRYTGLSEKGSNYPLIVVADGIRLALVNFTYGTNIPSKEGYPKVNTMNKDEISAAIVRAKKNEADFIIALPHWGEEYMLAHGASQEKMALWLAEKGVDAIVGTHPHVVQDSTIIRTKNGRDVPVFYSLGNVVSNMTAINTRLGLAVTLRFVHRKWSRPAMISPKIEYLWCTRPGTLTSGYMTIPVREYEGRKEEWKFPADYDNMMNTLEHVMKQTGINDKGNSINETD